MEEPRKFVPLYLCCMDTFHRTSPICSRAPSPNRAWSPLCGIRSTGYSVFVPHRMKNYVRLNKALVPEDGSGSRDVGSRVASFAGLYLLGWLSSRLTGWKA